eukprot:PhF_6_TR9675/c0_g2_i1/m.14889
MFQVTVIRADKQTTLHYDVPPTLHQLVCSTSIQMSPSELNITDPSTTTQWSHPLIEGATYSLKSKKYGARFEVCMIRVTPVPPITFHGGAGSVSCTPVVNPQEVSIGIPPPSCNLDPICLLHPHHRGALLFLTIPTASSISLQKLVSTMA